MNLKTAGLLVFCVGLLGGCETLSPVKEERDRGPSRPVDLSHVPDAVPRYEKRTIAGNKNPYTVLGSTYYLLEDETNYKERGVASWYGKKFHGRKTSNGETYDMYAMTAAHTTLPIPSYVRVTNLENQRSVVVRINDRGPFHDRRIIDLSYAAAQRLGFADRGVAQVEVEIIVPGDRPPPPLAPRNPEPDQPLSVGAFLQVGAFSTEAAARTQAERVAELTDSNVVISPLAGMSTLYRVRVGPLKGDEQVRQVREQLQRGDVTQSHIVYEQ